MSRLVTARRRLAAIALAAVIVTVVSACARYSVSSTSWNLPVGTVRGPVVALRAGIGAGVDLLWESDAQQTADLDAIAASGATWTTLDIDWRSIQGDGPDSFRWDIATDRAVANIRRHGLAIIGVAAYSPPWARTAGCPEAEPHCMPANPDDYARFVAAAAARYGAYSSNPIMRGSITHWQIWNEPNHQDFAKPNPDPDKYATMLKASYAGIKFADPSATVITGGTAPAPDAADGSDYRPETWLRGLYARGAGNSFDAVGHHPYAFPFNPLEPESWNTFTMTTTLHDIMAAHGDGAKKVWGTEMGAPTGTDEQTLTENQQAQWVHDYFIGWNTTLRDITGPLVWMPLRDAGTNIANRWDNMGLLYNNGFPKPAYLWFKAVMAQGV
ncbi:MAG: beta-xylosidase [Acidimicrobiia bacterium]